MVLVISDSSTLIHLAAVRLINLIRDYFPSILILRAVYLEVVISGDRKPGSEEVRRWIDNGERLIRDVQNTRLVSSLCHEIHQGEAEVIALAMDLMIHSFYSMTMMPLTSLTALASSIRGYWEFSSERKMREKFPLSGNRWNAS